MKTQLKPGDTIRIVGERGTAKIRAILTSMNGALLEKQIGGFRNWNLEDLSNMRGKHASAALGNGAAFLFGRQSASAFF
jgi:hypothetical protein